MLQPLQTKTATISILGDLESFFESQVVKFMSCKIQLFLKERLFLLFLIIAFLLCIDVFKTKYRYDLSYTQGHFPTLHFIPHGQSLTSMWHSGLCKFLHQHYSQGKDGLKGRSKLLRSNNDVIKKLGKKQQTLNLF